MAILNNKYSLRILKIEPEFYNKIDQYLINKFEFKYIEKHNMISVKNIQDISNLNDLIHVLQLFQIKADQLNFFISFTSEDEEITGFTFPKKITDLHQQIGGSIDISIINL